MKILLAVDGSKHSLAAAQCGRNSIGIELDDEYFEYARRRLTDKTAGLFSSVDLRFYT